MNKYSLVLATSLLFLAACSSGNFTKDELMNSLAENGIEGGESQKFYQMINAVGGFGFKGDGFSIEIYEFDSKNALENCVICTYKNGNFGMLIHENSTTSSNKRIIIKTFEEL